MREGEEVAAPGDCALRKIGEEQLSCAPVQSPTWNHLPPELHIHVLSFLLPKVLRTTPRLSYPLHQQKLLEISEVSHYMYHIASSNSLWRRFCAAARRRSGSSIEDNLQPFQTCSGRSFFSFKFLNWINNDNILRQNTDGKSTIVLVSIESFSPTSPIPNNRLWRCECKQY